MRKFLCLLVSLAPCASPAHADEIADFYRGKKIDIVVALGPGADYDTHARLLARHMGAHIPGNPSIVVQNMTGAGGLTMANWFANVAARDGTVIGVPANTMPAFQLVGGAGVRFDAGKFAWVGSFTPSISTMGAWHASGVRTFEDARRREVVVAASSPGAIAYAFPKMLNDFLGAKFRIVTGYQGVPAMSLAMERGEVEAHSNTWTGWKATRGDWVAQKKINILVQNLPKSPELPDVPAAEELARNEDDRRVVELVVAGNKMGRPFALPPGAPEDRVKTLRDAFAATMRDPEFLREAERMGIELAPLRGEDMQAMAGKLMSTPARLVEMAKPLIGN